MIGIHSNLEKEAKMIGAQVADRMELLSPWTTNSGLLLNTSLFLHKPFITRAEPNPNRYTLGNS